MHAGRLNHITKADKPFQSFSSDPNTAAATAIIHGDVHGSGESLLDRLGVIMSDDDRSRYAAISQHTYVEQYHQANLDYSGAKLLKQNATNKKERAYFKHIAQQKKKLWPILEKHIQEDLSAKKAIFDRIDVADPEKLRLLLGDVTGDRGCSELDILLLLVVLIKKGVNIKILLGNHDLETLVTVLTKNWAIDDEPFAIGDQVSMRSLINLKILLHYGFVKHEELSPLIEVWKSLLEPLYYFWKPTEDAITCTHAPVGLETFEALANTCDTPYDDMTDKALYQSLDSIRTAFKTSLNRPASDPRSFLSQIFREREDKAYDTAKMYPWHALTWRRENDGDICTHKEGQTYTRRHINGHDTPAPGKKSSTESLDNSWRKSVAYRAKYSINPDRLELAENANVLQFDQGNTLYYYALADNLIGYCGILDQGRCMREKFTASSALPPHYFSGVVQTDTLDEIYSLLLKDIQRNDIVVALPIFPLNYPHQPELTYVVTDYALADTPRPLQVQALPKKREPLSPLSPEEAFSHGNKRSRFDTAYNTDYTGTKRSLFADDDENIENTENTSEVRNDPQSKKVGSDSVFHLSGSLFSMVTGLPTTHSIEQHHYTAIQLNTTRGEDPTSRDIGPL